MKLKLLLADDDVEMLQIMHTMIGDCVDWCEVTGLAEDGMQALELLRETTPDVLVTDITMPQMDGLTLIAEAKKLLPDLKTILITCHEDFHYAKEAIQLMVDDYLVKYTLTQQEFVGCIERQRMRLLQQRTRRESFDLVSSEVYKNKEQFKETFLAALADGQTQKAEALFKKAHLYHTTLPQSDCLWAMLFVDDMPRALQTGVLDDEGMLLFALMNIVSDVLCLDTQSFVCLWRHQICILLFNEEGSAMKQVSDLCKALAQTQAHAQNVLHIRPSALYFQHQENVRQAAQVLESLMQARDQYFYTGSGTLCIVKPPNFSPPCDAESWVELFRQNLFQPDKLNATLVDITRMLTEKNCMPQHTKAVLEELNLVLDTALRRYGSKLTQVTVQGDTLAECERQLQANIATWVERMGRSGSLPLSQDIREMAQYVADHLDSDLSLEKVASVICKNSSYLSRLFKRETGLAFSEYITKKRIEKASWLLEQTAMSIEAVAMSIGMVNPQYFYKFFKRETGKKPSELRKTASHIKRS